MPDAEKLESLLVADCGSVNTKVGFVDLVGGEYRFIGAGTAATTAEPPIADISVGIRRAVEQIEARTERRLLTEEGQLITPERMNGQGVDAFVAITSAPAPLRVAVVGVSREISISSAAHAINSTYASVEAIFALDETSSRLLAVDGNEQKEVNIAIAPGGARQEDPAVVAAEALARANPDVIVLVGGIDGGPTMALYEMANLVTAIAAARDENSRPSIIFAGNRDARQGIAERVGRVAPLRAVDNVLPTLDRENPAALQNELETLYAERKITRLPGLLNLAPWSSAPMLPSARSLENVVRFLARRYNLSVVGADLGSATATIAAARGDAYARAVRADLGIGHNVENVVKRAGLERLLMWLPFEMSTDDALARLLNKSLRPGTIPTTREDARLLQAVARGALAITARESALDVSAPDLLLLTGGAFSDTASYGALALLALDALQPHGVFTLAVDALGLAPTLGALATVNAQAAANVLERDGLVTLGTVIAPISNAREGQVDLRVQIKPAGQQSPSGGSGAMNLEVTHGSLELIPLAPGQKASLEVRLANGVDLGPGRKAVFKAEVEGGALGLMIDARGRPIALPSDAEKRRAKIQQWLWDVGGEVSYG